MSFWMYLTIFISQVIMVSLALTIFSSLYIKSRKKGYIFISIIALLFIFQIINSFNTSIFLGFSILITILILSTVTYLIKRKKESVWS
ncbi:hypothetical protein AB685_17765 [Bacillus sp. LL01]|nr:hypothetical protein AB685_17765 [Bacillus sp. LL01]